MFYSLFVLYSSYSGFLPKFALVTPRWKRARSNWNFNTVCRMVSIRARAFLFGNLTYGRNRDLRNSSPTPRLWETSSRLAANAVTAMTLKDNANTAARLAAGQAGGRCNEQKKLRYRKEHSASALMHFMTFLRRKSVDGFQPLLHNWPRKLPNSAKWRKLHGHYAVQGHSRSLILVPIESLYGTSC